jgi:thymidylate synthase, flavin-dependent
MTIFYMPVIIKPKIKILQTWGSEKFLAAMTDVIYRGYEIEEALKRAEANSELVSKRITNFLKDGHHSVLEFMGASWLIEGSRALTHELIRHRIASYWQESQRYVDYLKGQLRYVLPQEHGSLNNYLDMASEAYVESRKSMNPEDSRYFLPNAMASRIWVQMNSREFYTSFLPLRTGLGAFHEIRLVAWLMYESLIDSFPLTSKWVWENLQKLHPDYCRDAEKLKSIYGSEDCRYLSIIDAFKKWDLNIPDKLNLLINKNKDNDTY